MCSAVNLQEASANSKRPIATLGTMCSRFSFSGMSDRTAASMLFRVAEGAEGTEQADPSTNISAAADDNIMLALHAEIKDRQEARRRVASIARGGRLLQDRGGSDEDGDDQNAYEQPEDGGMSPGSPATSGSGWATSPDGLLSDEFGPPSARYWRERASSSVGGRLSVDAHAARLRERHQVQAELRAWCEEVLEARPTAENGSMQLTGSGPSSPTACRLGGMPASSNHIEGQRSPCRHHHHYHRRRSQHHQRDSSVRSSTTSLLSSPMGTSSTGLVAQGKHSSNAHARQQEDVQGSSAALSPSSHHGLCLTPRTAEEFGAELRSHFEQKVEQAVQQRLSQCQQTNPAEQRFLQQMKQEHQQQLAQAQQQIATLKAGQCASEIVTSTTANAQTGDVSDAWHQLASGGCKHHAKQKVVLTSAGPDVQVLTILKSDSSGSSSDGANRMVSTEQQGAAAAAAAVAAALLDAEIQQDAAPTENTNGQHQQESRLQSTGSAGCWPSSAVSSTNSPCNQTKTVAEPSAAGAGSEKSSRKSSRRSTSADVGPLRNSKSSTTCKSKGVATDRPGSTTSAVADTGASFEQPLLSFEQQQALIQRLKNAEDVMNMLQADLEASLTAQHKLTHELEQVNTPCHDLEQLQQQKQQVSPAIQQEQKASTIEQQKQLQQRCEQLQQQVCELNQGVEVAEQQLLHAQQAAAAAKEQLQEKQGQVLLLEQACSEHVARELELQHQIKQLQNQLEQMQVQRQEVHKQPQMHETGTSTDDGKPQEICTGDAIQQSSQYGLTIQEDVECAKQRGAEQHQPQRCANCQFMEMQVVQLQEQLQRQPTDATLCAMAQPPGCLDTKAAMHTSEATALSLEIPATSKSNEASNSWPARTAQHETATQHMANQSPQKQQRPSQIKLLVWPPVPMHSLAQVPPQADAACRLEAQGGRSSTDACELVMLPGVRKMRPLSYRPAGPASSTDTVIGTSLNGATRLTAGGTGYNVTCCDGRADQLSPHVRGLFLDGLLTSRPGAPSKALMQLASAANCTGCGGSDPGATCTATDTIALAWSSAAGAVRHCSNMHISTQGKFEVHGSLRLTHSSRPRQGPGYKTSQCARPGTAASLLSGAFDACCSGSPVARSPRRPQTARSAAGCSRATSNGAPSGT